MRHSPLTTRHAPATERYEILERIGQGAMGLVYRARDVNTGRDVALKTLRMPDPEDVFRLKKEFRTLAGISHPNLAALLDLVVADDECFFTMEWVRGSDLLDWVRAGPPDAFDERMRSAFWQLASGVDALHRAGKLHRDIKPSNVMVTIEDRVVLLDFGLATGMTGQLSVMSMQGNLAGTFQYMSPEQAWGRELTAASDWYSMGVVLYEALSGVSPFAGLSPAELVGARSLPARAPHDRAPNVPRDLSDLAMGLLEPEPEARPSQERILGVLGASPDRPAPSAASSGRGPTFVNRRSEHERLCEAFERARGGSVLQLVEGEAGIGKSTLLAKASATFEERGALVLRSRCNLRETVPFKSVDALIDELSRYLVGQPPDELAWLMPPGAGALVKVFPVLGRVPFRLSEIEHHLNADPYTVRREAFRALRELLRRTASRRPLVLWIDDFQWTDADSLSLLRALLREGEAPPVLWLLAVRTGDDASGAPGPWAELAAVHDPERVARLRLGPLPPDGTRELARVLSGGDAPTDDVLRRIEHESGGSPFLVEALVQHRRDAGSEATGATVSDLVAARIERLEAAARRLLEIVVVAPGPLARDVALAAADVPAHGDVVASLERSRLLHPTRVDGRDCLEPAHSRIRDSVERSLPDAERRERHRRLAEVLRDRADSDPMDRLAHLVGAGMAREAAAAARQAAHRAADQLAFERAAALFGLSLELAPTQPEARDTRRRRAEALASAGRGRDAAEEFARAAETPGPEGGSRWETLMLRRRAAEAYLLSGHVEPGIAALLPVLDEIGVRYPRSAGTALLGALWQLTRLRLRGLEFESREEDACRFADLVGLDACHAAAKGLVLVDPARGAYFSLESLRRALEVGEPGRVGRALSVVGAALLPAGGGTARLAERMIETARRIADEREDPYLRAMVGLCTGQMRLMEGRWQEMLRQCDEGTALLTERCRGVTWERDIGAMAAMRALEELGRLPELGERVGRLRREADELGDRYAQVTARLYGAFWQVLQGDPDLARQEADAALELWPSTDFQLQHLYALRIHAFCDVVEGRPAEGHARVTAEWSRIRRAGLLRHALLRTDALSLRARLALAAAADADESGRRGLLRAALGDVRRLAAEARPDASATAELLRAGAEALAGNPGAARAAIDRAIGTYAQADMTLFAATARRAKGRLLGPDGGAGLVAANDAVLAEAGIDDPERWSLLVAPGLAGPGGQAKKAGRAETEK